MKAAAIMATAAMGLMSISAPAFATDANAGAAPSATEAVAGTAASGNKVLFPGNDGRAHTVTHDSKSFMVDGERLNVWSGEFHYWRLPSPDDWRDTFQKMRASGFNAVSLYFFWGLHSTEPGQFDFTGIKDLDLLLTMAEEEGLYVIARPGPYVNAEISMGGLPAYLTKNGSHSLRSTDPEALRESLDWINAFNKIALKHQVTDGGGSIVMYQAENELLNEGGDRPAFMKALVDKIKGDGITVPVFHNDYSMNGAYVPGSGTAGGNVGLDFYAFDQYPLGFTCSAGRGQIPDMEQRFRAMTATSPMFIAEGQGGAFTPWGANFNTDRCAEFVDPAFTRQYGVNNLNNGINMFNYYMQYGGTNWGWTGSPSSGFTSYDYGAAINEDRQLTPKATVQKELGYFQRDFDPISNMVPQNGAPVDGGNGSVKSYQRIASEGQAENSVTGNGARYLGFRQSDSNSTAEAQFTVPLTLGAAEEVVEASYTSDDRDTGAITFTGNWGKSNGEAWAAGNYKGTETFSDKAGDSVEYKFTGAGIRVIAAQSVNHGYGDVYIDGVKVGQTNTYRGQNANFQYVAFQQDGLDPAVEHTIKIVVTGQKDAASSGTFVTIDAFDVIASPDQAATVKLDDVDPAIRYSEANGASQWEHASGKVWTANDYKGTQTFSNVKGAFYEYTFRAAEVRLITPQATNHAKADVYIDGVLAGQTNSYVNNPNGQSGFTAFEKTGLDPSADHTIKVVNTGEKGDPAADGTFIGLDAIETSGPDTGTEAPADAVSFDRIPQKAGTFLKLHGRDAAMVVADWAFDGQKMLYSTSEIFTRMPFADGTLLALNGARDDGGETVLQYASEPQVAALGGAPVESTWDAEKKTLRLNYVHGAGTTVKITGGGAPDLLILTTDRTATSQQWTLEGLVKGTQENKTVMVTGTDLVRSAEFDGDTVHLTGDSKSARTIGIYAPAGITKATWNGTALATTAGTNGQLEATLEGPAAAALPALTEWKVSGENPESAVDFDDSAWLEATATTAANTRQGPGPNQGKVLDTAFYGFYEGDTWYRAHFTAASDATSIQLRGQGGNGANMLVWVNGTFAGAAAANGGMATIQVPAGVIKAGQETVVSAVVRNHGQNLDWSDDGLSRQNRGLFDAVLPSSGAVTWKLQGAKDKAAPVDTDRTMYNTGGLYGERAGWYLPGYPDSAWAGTTMFKPAKAGVTWYRTSFDLAVPAGTDTAVGLKINDAKFENGRKSFARAVIYVNGWNTGTWVGNVGPQSTFTIPSGFLNKSGTNTLAIALTTERDGEGPDSFTLVDRGTSLGGVPTTLNAAPSYTLPEVSAAPDKEKYDAGTPVAISGTSALAAIGDGALTNAVVDFGDGGEAVTVPVKGGAFTASRAIAADGSYTAKVSIKDAVSGAVLGSTELAVTVGAPEAAEPAFTPEPAAKADLMKGSQVDLGLGKNKFPRGTSEVALANLAAGEWFYVYLNDAGLGWHKALADGTVTVSTPADTKPGDNKVAVFAGDGTLHGWEALKITGPPAK
ncbi:beta-galactosidase [Arthrobacter stackebrandtii]|nr:beta-galactosidase [Arthrobacter stackebrandtii]